MLRRLDVKLDRFSHFKVILKNRDESFQILVNIFVNSDF